MSVPAEQRRYERYAIELQGRIGPVDGRQYECLVRDYCSGGMLLQQSRIGSGEEPPTYQPGQELQLRIEILTTNGSRAVRIGGSVAWARDDYFGLSFAKTSDAVVEALRRHDRLTRTGSLAEPDRGSGGETRGLARLRHAAQAALPPLLRDLLVLATEDLLG
ncbi:MAG: PilZ domain-containing protein, partial [Sedimenticolaceae bacterium]